MTDAPTLAERVKEMSDADLLRTAVRYNHQLRRGRRMVREGDDIIKHNISEFVICQNELQHRVSAKLELATDQLTDSRSASE